ncbi:GTP-sensing pleiotropic transcriptional regulator CodY [Clostridiaceae bacterium HSG29]|nr:GTP-sensing pleiotropic transcriptional regulator CodY [Clostridiaceae bacterium HSG29]
MSKILVEKMRRLNKIIQHSESENISFQGMSEIMMDIFDGNVYVLSKKGKVLGYSLVDIKNSNVIYDENEEKIFNQKDNSQLLKIDSTLFNITKDDLLEIFRDDVSSYEKSATIVPILGNGKRLGTFIVSKDIEFTDDDLVLAEYAATVIGLEIVRSDRKASDEERRKKDVVKMAIGTLSYSEIEAMEHIFNELEGSEGLIIASKVADRVGITRSVIVNALRKFESAGVIESRSLGMKGTFIKILNNKLLEEFRKVSNSYKI